MPTIYPHKNTAYGAYQLKKAYPKQVSLSFLLACLFVGLGVSIPLAIQVYRTHKEKSMLEIREKRVLDYAKLSAPPPIELDKPPEPPKELPKEPPKKATVKYVKPTVKPDEEVADEQEAPPTVDEMKVSQIGTETVEGDTVTNFSGEGYDTYDEVVVEEPAPKVYLHVSEMPSFPGGEEELLRYLAKNIKYPPMALQNKVQGLVITRFVVNAEGDIENIEVLRGIGAGCDEEAIRVLEEMPLWKPGFQNDRAVSVQYSLPIRFIVKP